MRRDAQYWDAVATTWQEVHPQTLWRVHSDAVNVALFAHWLPIDRIERLLKTDLFDEAFGDGLYPLLTSRARKLIGMDISVSTLHLARSRHTGLPATGADVRRLPFANGAFDVVISNSTLDHFESLDEIVASLREIRRVLQAGGQLLLTLDNLANPIIALRNALPFSLLSHLAVVPYYVGATCGPGRLRRILQQMQFEVLEITAVMHCPRLVAVEMVRVLERYASRNTQQRILRLLMAFERLSSCPTRFLTGYLVAVRAIRR